MKHSSLLSRYRKCSVNNSYSFNQKFNFKTTRAETGNLAKQAKGTTLRGKCLLSLIKGNISKKGGIICNTMSHTLYLVRVTTL